MINCLNNYCNMPKEVSDIKTEIELGYGIQKCVLYREIEQIRGQTSNIMNQVVVSSKDRKLVMSLTRQSIVGGHSTAKKTIDRVKQVFTGQASPVMLLGFADYNSSPLGDANYRCLISICCCWSDRKRKGW